MDKLSGWIAKHFTVKSLCTRRQGGRDAVSLELLAIFSIQFSGDGFGSHCCSRFECARVVPNYIGMA